MSKYESEEEEQFILEEEPEQTTPQKIAFVIGWIVTILQILLSGMAVLLLQRAQLLPGLQLGLILIILIALIIDCRILMRRTVKRRRYAIGMVIAAAICAVLLVLSTIVNSLTDTLLSISDTKTETTNICVYVRADDEAETIEDAADYPFGIMESLAREDTDIAIGMIEEDVGDSIAVTEYAGLVETADALLSGECDAIIMSAEYVDMITDVEGYESFDEEVKEIATYSWSAIVVEDNDDETSSFAEDGIFTMYISGIDTWGSIATKSRSDVNILAVVNLNTNQVLLVSTPRDYYVELSISNGVKDKLTHAGIYGIDCSVDTMEMLYDTEIDYYFRINFSGFETLIDALGGVTVYSEVAFDVDPDYHYTVGYNEMTGEEALAFARERYSFSDGDRQRGKNQMAVITGVISSLQSTAILNDFSGLMEGIEGSFETDMSYSEIAELVQDQLTSGESMEVLSYSVDGTGSRKSTYSISSSVYVMVPDEETVSAAKTLINSVLDDETITVDE